MDADIGSSRKAKLADLVVIDVTYLENIRVSENVAYTMLNGRLYDALDHEPDRSRVSRARPAVLRTRRRRCLAAGNHENTSTNSAPRPRLVLPTLIKNKGFGVQVSGFRKNGFFE